MRVGRWFLIPLLAFSLVLSACASQPAAPTYPQKPINIMVPYPAGGPIDMLARSMSESVKPFSSQPWAVMNRAGADGTLGTAELMREKPDGYNIGLSSQGALIYRSQTMELPYKSADDFRPLMSLVTAPYVLTSPPDVPWKDVKELVAYAKANPGKVRAGTSGAGDIVAMVLGALAGGTITVVPFEGAAPTVTAVLGGHIEVDFSVMPPVLPHIQAGKLRLLGTFGEKRNPLFPDVPTVREQGFDMAQGNYYFMFAPKGLPDSLAQAVHDMAKKAMETDNFKKFAADNTFDIDYKSGDELKQRLQQDYKFFGERLKK